MINFREYLDYSKIEKIGISFLNNPEKNEHGIYESFFDKSVYFTLPRSKIKEINQTNTGQYVCSYSINDTQLIEFLNGLQSEVINKIHSNTEKWFKKSIEMDKIIELCSNIHNNNLLEITIEDEDLIEDISDYNEDDECNLVVKLRNIQIFRENIKIVLGFEDLVYNNNFLVETEDSEENEEEEEEEDKGEENENEGKIDELNEDLATLEKIEKKLTETFLIETRGFNIGNSDDTEDVRSEVLELIKKKEQRKQMLLRNSSRARNASLSLRDQASVIDLEIDSYKKRLNSLN